MLVHARLAIVTNVWMELVSARRTDAQKFYFRRRVCARRKNNNTKNDGEWRKQTHIQKEHEIAATNRADSRRQNMIGGAAILCICAFSVRRQESRISAVPFSFVCAVFFSGAVFNSMTRAQCAWVSSFYLLRRNWTEETKMRKRAKVNYSRRQRHIPHARDVHLFEFEFESGSNGRKATTVRRPAAYFVHGYRAHALPFDLVIQIKTRNLVFLFFNFLLFSSKGRTSVPLFPPMRLRSSEIIGLLFRWIIIWENEAHTCGDAAQ